MAPAVRDAVLQCIGHLAPQDRVGMLTIPRAGPNVNLTTDREMVKAAVAELSGRAPRTEGDADAGCRTQQVLAAPVNVCRGTAGITGNRIIRLVGDSSTAMARLAASTSGYFRATFVPQDSERSGATRSLSVKVGRPDVEVLSSPNIVIPPARGSRSGPKAIAPHDMLRVGDAFRELPLHARAYASREESSDKARVVVMVEAADRAVALKAAAVGLHDDTGKLVAQAMADQQGLVRAVLSLDGVPIGTVSRTLRNAGR
jgi:hypothetical protein